MTMQPDIESESKLETKPEKTTKPKSHNMEMMLNAGLRIKSVLQIRTSNFKEYYSLGRKLGKGQFGTTFLCLDKSSGKAYACKSIAERKLLNDEDVENVRTEIQMIYQLAGHPNVVSIKGAYEDAVAVHVVMELCAGRDLFDGIIRRYEERKAAAFTRAIVGVVEACHSLGAMHRELTPNHFLFVNEQEESLLKKLILDYLCSLSQVIAKSPPQEEIAGLRELFKTIDTENNGQITFKELKAGLKRLGANLKESEVYDLMQAADVDNSGTIGYGEFVAATLHLNKIEREGNLFAAFSYFDKDGNGYITPDELQQACKEFGEEMIREIDQDNDGRIDYNEFVAMKEKKNVAGNVASNT